MRLERKKVASSHLKVGLNKSNQDNDNVNKNKNGQTKTFIVKNKASSSRDVQNSKSKPRTTNEKGKMTQIKDNSSVKPSKKEIYKSMFATSSKKSETKEKKKKFNPLRKIIPDKANNPKTSRPLLTNQAVLSLDLWNTSLHAACLLHYPAEEIFKIVRIDNSLFFKRNGSGDFPLHYACMDKVGVNPAVLDCLLLHNPCAVRQWNSDKCLPLHLACMIGAPSPYAVICLLKLYPEAVMDQCEFPLTSTGAESYWENNPKSKHKVFETNDGKFCHTSEDENVERGWSPLHLAVMNGVKPSLINAIIEVDKRCLSLKTSKGRTALECGIEAMNLIPSNCTNPKVTKNMMESLNILRSYAQFITI